MMEAEIKNRCKGSWSHIETPEINPINNELIHDKTAKNTQWEKLVSSTNAIRETGYLGAKK